MTNRPLRRQRSEKSSIWEEKGDYVVACGGVQGGHASGVQTLTVYHFSHCKEPSTS